MQVALLDDAIAWLQVHFPAVFESQVDFPFQHHQVIDGGSLMHWIGVPRRKLDYAKMRRAGRHFHGELFERRRTVALIFQIGRGRLGGPNFGQ